MNKYHFNVVPNQTYLKDILKKVTTVISANTNVVFKSLLIGLKYISILGEIDDHNQSIINQNIFQKNTIKVNPAIIGKYALENFLSLSQSKK